MWYFSEQYLWGSVIFFCDCEQLCVVRLLLANVRVTAFFLKQVPILTQFLTSRVLRTALTITPKVESTVPQRKC